MQELSDLGMFLLYIIHHASACRPFTKERLMDFIRDINGLTAVWRGSVMVEDEIEASLKECTRCAYIYTIQRRGDGGAFQPHFLLSPFGLEALALGVQKRVSVSQGSKEIECGYHHANKIFDLPKKRRRA